MLLFLKCLIKLDRYFSAFDYLSVMQWMNPFVFFLCRLDNNKMDHFFFFLLIVTLLWQTSKARSRISWISGKSNLVEVESDLILDFEALTSQGKLYISLTKNSLWVAGFGIFFFCW